MKLQYIKINGYKNLKEFEVDLTQHNGLTMIIGNNGSGKSNILEAISAIFANLYYNKNRVNFNYEIIYIINDKKIIIKKNITTVFSVDNKIVTKYYMKTNNLLPTNVIALYSGEDIRMFEKYYEQFTKEKLTNTERKMIYIDKKYWEIALITLIYSKLPDNINFIKEQLNIESINKILFSYNLKIKKHIDDDNTKAFLEKIKNLDDILLEAGTSYIAGSPNDVSRIYNVNLSFIENEKEFLFVTDATKLSMKNDLDYNELEMFNYLMKTCLIHKKYSPIKKIYTLINNSFSAENLSEGEKKLILIKAVLEFVSDENSLIILDEPDANVHEGRKKDIYDLLSKYALEYQREIIFTTHSPTLTHLANKENIIMLRQENNFTSVVDEEQKEMIHKLTSGIWSRIEQNIFINSNKPLILVEGKGDIEYINLAIKLISENIKEKYDKLDIDILSFGGTSHAKNFIEEIKKCTTNNKKIIVIFDRDDSGSTAIKECVGAGNNRGKKIEIIKKENVNYFMLPKTDNHEDIDFMIEDYFFKEKKKDIIQVLIDKADGYINKYPKDLKASLKDTLSKDINSYIYEDVKEFKLLLDTIASIIDGTAVITEI